MKESQKIILGVCVSLVLGVFLGWMIFATKEIERDELGLTSTYAVYKGQTISLKEREKEIESELLQMRRNEFYLKKSALEGLVAEKVSALNPKLTEIPQNFQEVTITDEELKAFLQERSMDAKALSDQDKENILGNMRLQKAKKPGQEKLKEIIEKEVKWVIDVPARRVTIPDGLGPTLGSKLASMKITVLTNYHCPFCPEAERRIAELQKRYGDQLKIHYRFSMNDPESSIVFKAAEATYCAHDQGKFFEYKNLLMTQPFDQEERLFAVAKEVDLKLDQFEGCLKDRKHRDAVSQDVTTSYDQSIHAQPMFVINGKILPGQTPIEEILLLLEN